uniref:PLD phosphodiesterase domain-containing protein n=1 Tax=Daphnia galeata TaxID=27404 RepID=A0A8J2RQH3_9CRUS|nr:unnamed protein product [Daphnia galeata]
MVALAMKWVQKEIKENIKSTAAEDEGRFDMLGLEVGDPSSSSTFQRRAQRRPKENIFKSTFLTLSVIIIVTLLVLFFPHGLGSFSRKQVTAEFQHNSVAKCNQSCHITLVESIPEGLVFPNQTIQPSIFDSWLRLIDIAESSIDIASFYWSLNGEDVVPHPSAWKGELVLKQLKEAGLERGIRIRVAQNQPSKSAPDEDTSVLESLGAALVRNLDFNRLIGAGILHTKLWVVDGKHFFVGSANMDWRSLTQVKELGATVYDCPCLAKDMSKIFEVYWALGEENATIPDPWPQDLATHINHTNPLTVDFNETTSSVYLASSPPQLCADGRTTDLQSVLHTMEQAHQYINIAVMDYIPAMLYTPHHQYWPVIDNQLRRLAIDNGIKIRLLVSHWKHTTPAMAPFLKSLADISKVYPNVDVQVKIFVVPAFSPDQEKIPFARVNHNKYMVTDNAAYIGTSNWSGDYFINTGGVGLIVNGTGQTTLQSQLKEVFDRDWNSAYSHPLDTISVY